MNGKSISPPGIIQPESFFPRNLNKQNEPKRGKVTDIVVIYILR